MSNVELAIFPKAKDLGDNFQVRRSLPNKNKRMVGPFIFWDHMGPVTLLNEKEMKVRAHPHIGLATITWLFSGEITHRDSLGNIQVIRPGEVNWMTSGKGIVHSERSSSQGTAIELEGIQLWLALPKQHEDVEPSFFHCKIADVPSIATDGFELSLVAGKAFEHTSPVPVYSDLFYLQGTAAKGSQLEYSLNENHEGAVYVVDGEIEIEGKTYDRFNLVTFKKGTSIDFKVLSDAKIMIFGGEVFPEPRHIWWNFVATSKDKIEKAKQMWKNDEFPPVIDETEKIPLPDHL